MGIKRKLISNRLASCSRAINHRHQLETIGISTYVSNPNGKTAFIFDYHRSFAHNVEYLIHQTSVIKTTFRCFGTFPSLPLFALHLWTQSMYIRHTGTRRSRILHVDELV